MALVMEMPHAQTSQSAVNPRKRKKRTPAPGAAVDCFTCAENHLSCDRKRPFCSQCLDAGKDCSGYKTQLTWGVGVASRGKLRGLSLPIAGTERLSTNGPSKNKKRKESTASRTELTPRLIPHSEHSTFNVSDLGYSSSQAPLVSPALISPETSPKSVSSTSPATTWDAPQPYRHLPSQANVQVVRATQVSDQDTPVVSPIGSTSHFQSFPFQTNMWESNQQPVVTGYPTPSPILTSTSCGSEATPGPMYFENLRPYDQPPALVSPSQTSFGQEHRPSVHDVGQAAHDGISMLLHAGQSMAMSNSAIIEDADEECMRESTNEYAVVDDFSLVPASSSFAFDFPMPAPPSAYNVGKTMRMQYLINYYAEVISPVIVAFDGPSNPFRTHILQLATNSETLQHAISALAASNLRQRRGIGLLSTGKTAPARRSSFAHVQLSNEYSQGMLSPEEQMREETLHKRMAVSQLNQQLAHPVFRKNDSTLATLLILCLFHICDSGVAKFQTQFAGVRKLLALRGGDDRKIGNDDSRWMSRLFTWFDSLAATVNDREGQITGSFLEMPALCGDWSLENMAGIDSRLFKIISKLGTLNMLKQGKSSTTTWPVSRPLSQLPSRPASFSAMDGNGWVPRVDNLQDGDFYANDSKQFWKEWQDLQHELLAWQLDTTLFDTVSKEACCLTVEQRMDLENISQSFRYSALVYLQRLAFPEMPSSDQSIQTWVRQSLTYIKRVQSDVYLLWPLFITGSECIDEDGRDLIRGRCTDIQKDSGFVNNASCLQLLEKVWRFNSPNSSPRSAEGEHEGPNRQNGSAFMFRDVMVREAARTEGEGEYIVV